MSLRFRLYRQQFGPAIGGRHGVQNRLELSEIRHRLKLSGLFRRQLAQSSQPEPLDRVQLPFAAAFLTANLNTLLNDRLECCGFAHVSDSMQ